MRALNELEASGFITRQPQFHDSGARRSSRYYPKHPLAPHCSPRPNPGSPRPDSTRAPSQRGTGPVSERHPTGVPNWDLLNPPSEPPTQPPADATSVLRAMPQPWRVGGRMPETSYLPLRLLWRQAGRPRTSQPIFREARRHPKPGASPGSTSRGSTRRTGRILPHCGVVRRMRRRAVTHDHRNPVRRHRSGRVLSAMQSAKTATRPNGGESNWTTTCLTICRCYWQCPARRRYWASVAPPHTASQRPANFRCADSAVACTSSPQDFESWSHHDRIGLFEWHPLSAVG